MLASASGALGEEAANGWREEAVQLWGGAEGWQLVEEEGLEWRRRLGEEKGIDSGLRFSFSFFRGREERCGGIDCNLPEFDVRRTDATRN